MKDVVRAAKFSELWPGFLLTVAGLAALVLLHAH